jgi:BlaI family transcriptional regulator, penicillinase repressor
MSSLKFWWKFTKTLVIIRPTMTTKQIRPTKLELSILNVLWQKGPATVREIHAVINQSKPTAINTVLRMLQIMTEKGLATRDDTVRPQIYRPRYSQQQTQTHLVKDLIQRAFDGSVKEMVLRALSTRKPSPKTLKAMEKLLEEFEGDSK